MKKQNPINSFEELIECLKFVDDPRVVGRSKHLLIDILVISICAVLCGAEGVFDIEEFALEKEIWLRKFLLLPSGIPSHDTIARVLSLVDPLGLEIAFHEWIQHTLGSERVRSISLDGKTTKGTERNFSRSNNGLHMVSVYSHELGLTLMEIESEGRGAGESSAAMDCIHSMDLDGVMVLADAGLASKRITQKIKEKNGDYVVPIKGNQRFYLQELEAYFLTDGESQKIAFDSNKGHGRSEERICQLLSAQDLSDKFKSQWLDAKVVFRIERKRTDKDKRCFVQKIDSEGSRIYKKNDQELRVSQQVTYYVSSRGLTAQEALTEVRKHWGIENQLHWVLDVAFGEDDWRVRAKPLARTLSLMRKIAFNIIKRSKTKGSIRIRIKKAGWNNKFLEQLLFGREF